MSKDELKNIVLELLADEDVINALYRPFIGDEDAQEKREIERDMSRFSSRVKLHLSLNSAGVLDVIKSSIENSDELKKLIEKGDDEEGESE